MNTDANKEDQPDALSVHENAQNLLLALYNSDDHRASTSDLRKPTGLSASNISGRHAKTLIREGWAEKVGSEDVGARSDANIYELTHRGKREANLLLRKKPLPMSEEDRTQAIRELQDEVRKLKNESKGQRSASADDPRVDDLAEQVETLETRLDTIEEWMERFVDNVDTIADKVNDLRETVY